MRTTPVTKEELDKKGKLSPVRKQGRTQRVVLCFLAEHSNAGFSQKEVAEANKLPSGEQQARQACMALVAKGLVRRREIPVETQKGIQYRIYYDATELGVKVSKQK